jgi:hypothetical protein
VVEGNTYPLYLWERDEESKALFRVRANQKKDLIKFTYLCYSPLSSG